MQPVMHADQISREMLPCKLARAHQRALRRRVTHRCVTEGFASSAAASSASACAACAADGFRDRAVWKHILARGLVPPMLLVLLELRSHLIGREHSDRFGRRWHFADHSYG